MPPKSNINYLLVPEKLEKLLVKNRMFFALKYDLLPKNALLALILSTYCITVPCNVTYFSCKWKWKSVYEKKVKKKRETKKKSAKNNFSPLFSGEKAKVAHFKK